MNGGLNCNSEECRSAAGRRRIVLTGPSLPLPLLLSGPQSCRRLVRRNQNRGSCPLWIIGLPCQTRGRSLRQADYPQLRRGTHPTTNQAATPLRDRGLRRRVHDDAGDRAWPVGCGARLQPRLAPDPDRVRAGVAGAVDRCAAARGRERRRPARARYRVQADGAVLSGGTPGSGSDAPGLQSGRDGDRRRHPGVAVSQACCGL